MNEVKTKEELVKNNNQPQNGINLSVINHKINLLNKRIKDVQYKLSEWYEDYKCMCSTHSSDLGFNQISSDMIDERIQIEEELNSLVDEKRELLRIKKDKEMDYMFRICSYSEGWKIHTNGKLKHQIKSIYQSSYQYKKRNRELRERIRELEVSLQNNQEERIRELEVIIENKERSMKGLLGRNRDLEYRLNYEKRVVKSLKEELKKFEENNGGGENQNPQFTTTLI